MSEPTPLSSEQNRIVDIMEQTCRAGDEYGCDFNALWDVIAAKDASIDAQATEIAALKGALEHWVCRAHRAGEQGEHQVGNPDCDYARRVLGQQA